MMTQTHLLVNASLFAKPGHKVRNTAALLGGILPDIAIFIMFGWEKAKGTPDSIIWGDIYFNSAFWQDAVAWGNSAPLYIIILGAGLLLARSSKLLGVFLTVLGAACLVHLALDFPLHVNDAHRHFFPLSDYRFVSQVSYWDPAHYGTYASIAEAILAFGLCIYLFRRFKSALARIPLVLLMLAYIAVPAFFFWTMGNANALEHNRSHQINNAHLHSQPM